MQKTCALSDQKFTVFPEDQAAYEKFGVQVPTLCPLLRLVRKMSFRNERIIYRRKCDVTGKDIISSFHPDSPYKVCEKNYWYSDKFDPMSYGREFDFGRPFFDQFHEFLLSVPLPSLRVESSENCEYNSDTSRSKDCYLCARCHESNNCLYCYRVNSSQDCVDCRQVSHGCELLYECIECISCYDSQYLERCQNCSNSMYLSECVKCMDSMLCVGQSNKRFCFLNEQMTEEGYRQKIASIDFGSRAVRADLLQQFETLKKSNKKTAEPIIVSSENCTGDNIYNAKNCWQCYEINGTQDGRYLFNNRDSQDVMDCYSGKKQELNYECTSCTRSYGVKFSARVTESHDCDYSMYCTWSNNLFGCVGLQNEKYCIFNKQYSEEDYKVLREKIITHMKQTGEWGEFFPVSLSPFAYNETVAHEFYALEKDFVLKQGWRWAEKIASDYKKTDISIVDNITEVSKDICTQILSCETSGKNYQITPKEFAFYQKQQIPVPVLCPDERHKRRFKLQKIPLFQ